MKSLRLDRKERRSLLKDWSAVDQPLSPTKGNLGVYLKLVVETNKAEDVVQK